ncbi:TIGR00282 family metallophosphoesterase [Thermaerobacter sp. FW80]|uniref:TIGR00282 family metallophosphoesterase n=1 Tax=Thermaerobacter sp. FW80 TaxID=2546351 RepID=UPI000DB4E43C|nr:TIGR00282 family metallophosphoesterase [Thermaerobacter sp. FW80]PZN02704.1 MAG: TIGR00282 family metallophosphoesterase [Bacillota bacterium]QBS37882.1 TIGR00282 family metallophosphoesterase [Thermaerobacter sp. FW80]
MRLLFIGDVVGRAGRRMLRDHLESLIEQHGIELTVVNGENAAGGWGLTPETADELFAAGADVITLGNHWADRKEILPYLERNPRVLRPLNWPGEPPGQGAVVAEGRSGCRVAVLCLMGRVFADSLLDDPFVAADRALTGLAGQAAAILVDVHGDATSEKQALAWYLDGRVSAVVGTHTHTPTADERVLPGGTAAITDVGMTGPRDSIIGFEPDGVIRRLRTQLQVRLEVARGPRVLCGVIVDVDRDTGKATAIERIRVEDPG